MTGEGVDRRTAMAGMVAGGVAGATAGAATPAGRMDLAFAATVPTSAQEFNGAADRQVRPNAALRMRLPA